MLRDLRKVASGTELAADICVVGAGAAGITLARRLAGKGLQVLVLESGSFEVETAHQALYAGRMSGIDTWRLDERRLRLLGGSTGHWGGYCMPLLPSDFEEREWIPHSGWPIRFEDLEPYYRLAQEDVRLAGFLYDAARVAEREGLPLLEGTGALATYLYQLNRPPVHMGSEYREELDAAADVVVQMWANATEIVLDQSRTRVDRLVVKTLGGGDYSVVADRFVLAMGGLENVRLLLASNRQVQGGVANSSGLVGAHFMEHPHLYQSAVWLEPGRVNLDFYEIHDAPVTTGDRTMTVLGVLGLSDEVRRAEGLPHLTINMHIIDPGEEPVEALATGPIAVDTIAVLNRRTSASNRAMRLSIRAEQTPLRESAVTLTDEVDALGVPRLDLHWSVSDSDLRAYARAMEIVGAELAFAGLGRLWTPRDADGRFDHNIRSGGHHMGTLRMHEDPAQGVVNRNCRAHDVDNLYVAGSCVFTTGGAANPTLTLIALAERLAAHLVGADAEAGHVSR